MLLYLVVSSFYFTSVIKSSLLFTAAGTLGYQASYANNKLIFDNSKDKKGMLQHNVYFWLKKDLTESEIHVAEQEPSLVAEPELATTVPSIEQTSEVATSVDFQE